MGLDPGTLDIFSNAFTISVLCSMNMSDMFPIICIITREVSVTHAMKLMVQFVGKIYRVTTHDVHAHNVQYL